MRIGLQSLAGSSARIERLRGFLVHFSRSPCFSPASSALLALFSSSSRPPLPRLSAAARLFRAPFSRDSSPFVRASSRCRRPLSPNR
ncbi:hypothetical protein QZN29_14505 [Burkholderia multivorans]|nr:hypothetical protein [Burkholderia multivorans]MCA8261527.1 hypothetical protein [Burkholderia multivorans]MCL4627144.1 hypothetical protein [Burkholderia multivorans]MCO1357793.1 hypothetical protein [Burkholderia multivorans]MCO1384110.1 hypothetical protein [Burkholderia multivorans]MCO1391359.1 hypothetical protein [Burkholderia multivorans]